MSPKGSSQGSHSNAFTGRAQAFLCNMLENEEEEIMVNGNEIILDFRAFEVKTVRISYKSSRKS